MLLQRDQYLASAMPTRRPRLWLCAIVLVHLLLAASFSRIIYPIDDEAYYASSAANLVMKGHFGTTTYETHLLPNLERHSYWIVPVYPILLAGWFRVVGVGLWEQRLLSVLFGGLAVWAWYRIALALSGSIRIALGAAALVALDHTLLSAANGRPDLMGHAWGVIGIAAYLSYRETSLRWACCLGYLGAALAGMSHPLPGVLAFANISLLVVLLDRRRFDLRALAAAIAPFAVGVVALALYVHPNWQEAYHQFRWNATWTNPEGGPGRLIGGQHLLSTWWRVAGFVVAEFTPPPDGSAAGWIKLLVPLTYAVAVVLSLAVPAVRSTPALRILLALGLADCILLPVIAAYHKWQYYMHILILFPLIVVLVLAALSRARSYFLLASFAVLIGGVVLVQAARIVHSLKQDSLGTRYEPSAARLRQPPFDKGTFWGKAYWAYAVGLDRLTEDNAFGYFSHKRKDFLLLSLDQPGGKGDMPKGDKGEYVVGMLAREYTLVYENQTIRVYAKRRPGGF